MNINNTYLKKIKIISTMGPTFETSDVIEQLLKSGVNVVRLNTSHGDLEEHGKRIDAVKKARKKLNLPISILLDTKGPEIRIHKIENGKMNVDIGEQFKIYAKKEIIGKNNEFSVTYKDLATTVKKDDFVMIDDGKLTLQVVSTDIKEGSIIAKSQNKHYIGTKKAVNIPGADLKIPFISKHDIEFIKWAIPKGIDYVAASFVRSVDDVKELRKLLDDNGGQKVRIMSKIEALKAIENLNGIIAESDSIMLARGDLGVEIPYYEVPFYENLIINKCRAWGKPITIATQMLDSMADNPRPTRAEVTDVYFAAISGTDSTMLSGETASGSFPNDAVKTMARINVEAENNFNYLRAFESAYAFVESSNAESAYLVAKKALVNDTNFIITFSEKGRLLDALSRFRPNSIIIGLVKDKDLVTKYGVHYGVYAKHHTNLKDYDDDNKISAIAKELGIQKGTKVLVAKKDAFKELKIK